jgi:hypothetical protein
VSNPRNTLMYVCGWPPHPALILSPIEHFEITS